MRRSRRCPLPDASFLHLSPEGFTTSSLFRRHTVTWTDVGRFEVLSMKTHGVTTNKAVSYNYSESYQQAGRLRKASRWLVGADASLPDSYGLKAEQLAELMNIWREYHATARDRIMGG